MNTNKKRFCGPVFIIGTARSGTTMLRELLNTHPEICISRREYPDFARIWSNWPSYGDLSDFGNFTSFYEDSAKINSIDLGKLYGKNGKIETLKLENWYSSCDNFTPQGVLEPLIRFHVSITQPSSENNRIWGDKSPQNLPHVTLLSKSFPAARFILLLRDPRDIALSVDRFSYRHYPGTNNNKQFDQAWKYAQKIGNKRLIPMTKNICLSLLKTRKTLLSQPSHFIEVRYDDILKNSDEELRRIAEFLDVDDQFDIETIETPVLYIESKRWKKGLMETNVKKYKKLMSQKVLNLIDEKCGVELFELGYETNSPQKTGEISRFSSRVFGISEFLTISLAYPKHIGMTQTANILCRRIGTRIRA